MIRFVNLLAALILQMFFMALQRVKKQCRDHTSTMALGAGG
jgi:hypothetical protein